MASSDTTFFYALPEDIGADQLVLRDDDARHATRALRLRAGDDIHVVDGLGGWYGATIRQVADGEVQCHIRERRMGVGEAAVYVHLAVAGIKSRSRFDVLLEKATEVGVARITVFRSRRSEASRVDLGRSQRVMRAAMKQSRRSRIPLLEGPVEIKDLFASAAESRRIICEDTAGARSIGELGSHGWSDVLVVVGPEGGFDEDEIKSAQSRGFEVALLGERRLRTETAGIVASAAILIS